MRSSASARVGVALTAITLLAASCGGGKSEDAGGDVGAGVGLRTTTTVKAGAATTAAPATQATAPAGSASVSAKPGAPASGNTAPKNRGTVPSGPGFDPVLYAARGNPGDAAGVILQPAPAKRIVIEIMEEPGVVANKVGMDTVIQDVKDASQKNVGEVHTPLPGPGDKNKKWAFSDLAKLADSQTKIPQGGDTFVFKFLFVNGHSDQNHGSATVLGTAFRGDLFVAFPDDYTSATTPQRVLTAVMVHETGHLMGLVDLWLKTGREDTVDDPAKHGHSRNKGSVMYWAVDPFAFGGIFGSSSDKFDADDLHDLASIRNGAAKGSKG